MTLPYIDIYVLTSNRERRTLEKFLDEYTDRESIEDMHDSEINMLPKDRSYLEVNSEDYIWIKAETLTNCIDIGLSNPSNCFTLYLRSKHREINLVILSFTQDGKLIVGLSIFEYIDAEQTIDNYKFAKELKDEMYRNYNGSLAYFGLEASPAHTEEEFKKQTLTFINN
ncbi:MAG: hypothetical protein RL660_2337 [Bacteroidota bacterium]|jgi:hypothetical protein